MEKIKMGIDKETGFRFLNIVIDNNPQYLKDLIAQANSDDQNDEDMIKERGCNVFSLTMDGHSFRTEEFYFDEQDNEITISGELLGANGKTYIYLCIPLSDTVLIDIIAHSLKKLGKLKTAMEALK